MLKRMKRDEVERYANYGYMLSYNPSVSSCPAFFDEIQTEVDYRSHLEKSTTPQKLRGFCSFAGW